MTVVGAGGSCLSAGAGASVVPAAGGCGSAARALPVVRAMVPAIMKTATKRVIALRRRGRIARASSARMPPERPPPPQAQPEAESLYCLSAASHQLLLKLQPGE